MGDRDELTDAADEVVAAFEEYERALIANDLDVLDGWFWHDAEVLRFGIADAQLGFAEVQAWRAAATPVPASRRITSRHVLALTPDVVCVDITFGADGQDGTGRQSQVWHRRDEGWRIVRAHVSIIPS
jgi:ketosteroid isomerase-like protein